MKFKKSILLLTILVIPCVSICDDLNIETIIKNHSETFGVDERLIKAVIKAESNFNIYALSPKGAMGLMQLMPATAKRFGVNKYELYIAEKNIEAGVKYLKFLQSVFKNDLNKVIASYNAGENAIIKYNGIPPYKETINYVKRVNSYLGNKQPMYLANSLNKSIKKVSNKKAIKTVNNNCVSSINFCDSGEF